MNNQRIIYIAPGGGTAVIIPTEELPIEQVAAKDVPPGVAYEIVDTDAIPSDRTFRGAWVIADAAVDVDLGKARDIAHDIRRSQRAEEFAPLDEIIAKRIPGVTADEAEAQRQEIRDRYAVIQEAVDGSETVGALKEALGV